MAKTNTAKIPDDEEEYVPKQIPVEDIEELEGLDEEVETLAELTAAAQRIAEKIADQKDIIQSMMETYKDETFSVKIREGLGISYVKSLKPRTRLVAELLIMAGVTDKQLKKGTKEDPPKKPYVTLLLPRKRKE